MNMLLDDFIKENKKDTDKLLYKWIENNFEKIEKVLEMFAARKNKIKIGGYSKAYDVILNSAKTEGVITIGGREPTINDLTSGIHNHRKKLGLTKTKK